MSLSYTGSAMRAPKELWELGQRRRKSEMVSFCFAEAMAFRAWALGDVRFGFISSPLAL